MCLCKREREDDFIFTFFIIDHACTGDGVMFFCFALCQNMKVSSGALSRTERDTHTGFTRPEPLPLLLLPHIKPENRPGLTKVFIHKQFSFTGIYRRPTFCTNLAPTALMYSAFTPGAPSLLPGCPAANILKLVGIPDTRLNVQSYTFFSAIHFYRNPSKNVGITHTQINLI